jgi:hypothetical protein
LLQGGSDGSTIVGNTFRMTQAQTSQQIITESTAVNNILVADNSFLNIGGSGGGVNVSGNSWLIRGNNVSLAQSYGGASFFVLSGSDCGLVDNRITTVTGALAANAHAFSVSATSTNAKIVNNKFLLPSGQYVAQVTGGTPNQFSVHDNDWGTSGGFRSAGGTVPTQFEYYANAGAFSTGGQVASTMGHYSGMATSGTNPNGTALTKDLLCKYDGSGNFTTWLHGDSGIAAAGFSPTTVSSGSAQWTIVFGQAGGVYPNAAIDSGGCTAGDLLIPATNVGADGKLKTTSSQVTIPSAGPVFRALGTAGANGNCPVQIIRLQ